MWLVLCEPYDVSAIWAYNGLKSLDFNPIKLVNSEILSCGLRWNHRIDSSGVKTTVELADGTTLKMHEIKGMLNRLTNISTTHLQKAKSTDLNYAAEELNSFFLSWIYSMPCTVINSPQPYGLSGKWRYASEWIYLASKAGLPVHHYEQFCKGKIDNAEIYEKEISPKNITSIIVLEGNVFGTHVPAKIIEASKKLAKLADASILGITFDLETSDNWTFIEATLMPDLRLGGKPLLDKLASILRDGSAIH